MNTPFLSIITINFNNAEGLRKTLESVKNQTSKNYEHIIIDGASTDESVFVINEFLQDNDYAKQVTFWCSEKDNGIYDAMNKGVVHASGKYCLFLNSGDYLADNEVISRILQYKYPFGSIIYTDAIFFNRKKEWKVPLPKSLTPIHLYNRGIMSHQNMLFPTSFMKTNPYSLEFKIAGDYDLILRAFFIHEMNFYHISDVISKYEAEMGLSSNSQFKKLVHMENETQLKRYIPKSFIDVLDELNAYEKNYHGLLRKIKRIFHFYSSLKNAILSIPKVCVGNILGFLNLLTLKDFKRKSGERYLYVDITETYTHDGRTGISRVTKGIKDNLQKYVYPYEVVFVYAKTHHRGFYSVNTNKPIKVTSRDFFFELDLSKFLIPNNKKFIVKLRKIGTPVWFFVHDLLPINYPQYCREETIEPFKKWLDVVKISDGFIANSKSTENEMRKWLAKQPEGTFNTSIKSGYIHLGSDFKEITQDTTFVEKKHEMQFLAVSTVEPRKRYDQIISAFDILWEEGYDIIFHIVGTPGWNNNNVFKQIRNNPQYNKLLVWHDKYITDEELAKLYATSNALIFASDTEGFGLALVEAASYKKPLIVRDIPIFHEVTDDKAFFFNGDEPEDLSNAIKEWIKLYKTGNIPIPNIKLYTWEESSAEVARILFNNNIN